MKLLLRSKGVLFILALSVLTTLAFQGGFAKSENSDTVPLVKSPSIDTFVRSGRPKLSYSPRTRISVGHESVDDFNIERSLLRFNISSEELPQGSDIDSAKLSLFLAATTSDKAMEITVFQISNEWDENVTWEVYERLSVSNNLSASTVVDKSFTWHQWNLTELIQNWVNDPNRNQHLDLVLQANITSGQRVRLFWANECNDSDCNGNRPKLEIDFALPTPTPIPPTPTPTPQPTPGIVISLSQSSSEGIDKDEKLVYTINYQNNGIDNLADVLISNKIPEGVTFSQAENGEGRAIGDVVLWNIGELAENQNGTLQYTVKGNSNSKDFVIRNVGAIATWSYQGEIYGQRSNFVFNPPSKIYIPEVIR